MIRFSYSLQVVFMKNFMVFLILIICHSSFSKESLQFLTEEFPPYNYQEEKNKKLKGVAVELLEAVHRRLKVDFNRSNYYLVPWARGYGLAQKKGKMVLLFSTTRTKERENMFKWFGPIANTSVSIFSLKNADSLSSDQLKSKIKNGSRFVGIRNDNATLKLKGLGLKSNQLTEVNRFEQMIRMMKKKRVNYFAYDKNVSKFLLIKKGFDPKNFKVVHELKTNELWFSFNKTVSDSLVKKYQKALDSVKRSDKKLLKVLKAEYGMTPTLKKDSLFPNNKW